VKEVFMKGYMLYDFTYVNYSEAIETENRIPVARV
jgi:hypothetical protein